MDRAGSHARKLATEELESVFALVAKGGSRTEALRLNPGRNKNTIFRLFSVTREFQRGKFGSMTTETAQGVADKVGYSVGTSYVKDIYAKWAEWNRIRGVQESEEFKVDGVECDHKVIKNWIGNDFERAVIVKEALRQELQSQVRRAFSERIILPTYPYGPLEREFVRSIKQRDSRLQIAFSDFDTALNDRDKAKADLAVEGIFQVLDEWITL